MKKLSNYIDHLLMLFLISSSGFPLVYNDQIILLVILFITFFIWLNRRGAKVSKGFVTYLLVFILIFAFQTISFNYIAYVTWMGFFTRILIAFFVVSSLGHKFIRLYVKQIYVFVLISFVFYIIIVFDKGIYIFLQKVAIKNAINDQSTGSISNLIIYNLNVYNAIFSNIPRNSGPFWEPGAFSGFVLLALSLNNIILDVSLLKKRNLIFITCVVTTFSTTGILALMLLLLYNLYKSKNPYRHIILFFYIFLSLVVYYNVPFLKTKIENQIQASQININRLEFGRKNRFESFLVDINDFWKRPFFGRGPSNRTRYKNPFDVKINNRNNGVTDFLVKFGLIGFLVYFVSMYFSLKRELFKRNNFKYNANFILFLIIVIGFSELYYMFPFFISLSILKYTT